MGWVNVPTLVHRLSTGLVDGDSLGYLAGTGDDAGWRLFYSDASQGYLIAQTFHPTFTVDGNVYRIAAILYNGQPVWEYDGMFIFTSVSLGIRILKRQLTEPNFIERIDETTGDHYVESGDAYWEAPGSPSVGDSNLTFEAAGTAQSDLVGSFDWPHYERVDAHETQPGENAKPFLGLFWRQDTDEYKLVGTPRFDVYSGPTDFTGEIFARDNVRDSSGRSKYTGTLGHSIRFDSGRSAWCIGTPGGEEGDFWWESAVPPCTADVLSAGSPSRRRVTFTRMVVDSEGEASHDGTNIVLRLRGFADTGARATVLVGEVEVWR